MDITPKIKKNMSKEEVSLLIDLIETNTVLTSKETNATTNKTKEDTWNALVTVFNAKSGSFPRTKEQLKFKWDNLKKAARKRTQQLQMNSVKLYNISIDKVWQDGRPDGKWITSPINTNSPITVEQYSTTLSVPGSCNYLDNNYAYIKPSGGKPDYIPTDEILDRVMGLLGFSCTDFVVPVVEDTSDDGNVVILDADHTMNVNHNSDELEDVKDLGEMEVLYETPNNGIEEGKYKVSESKRINEGNSWRRGLLGMPVAHLLRTIKKGKRKAENDGRVARNLAMTRYYNKKAEKLDLEIKLLRYELDQRENKNCNVNYQLHLK